jgi:hypothetical protein
MALLNGSGLMDKEEVLNFLEDYNNMAAGKLIIPSTDSLGPGFELICEDLEQFYLGYSEEAFNRGRIIADLEPHSRAALAGLRNGVLGSETPSCFSRRNTFEGK